MREAVRAPVFLRRVAGLRPDVRSPLLLARLTSAVYADPIFTILFLRK
jgi:hypothetical protein